MGPRTAVARAQHVRLPALVRGGQDPGERPRLVDLERGLDDQDRDAGGRPAHQLDIDASARHRDFLPALGHQDTSCIRHGGAPRPGHPAVCRAARCRRMSTKITATANELTRLAMTIAASGLSPRAVAST